MLNAAFTIQKPAFEYIPQELIDEVIERIEQK
jgi:translation initiation factor 2B subunit (eIF-2B alpha/beta/delta family)